jgi:hypothetical protein
MQEKSAGAADDALLVIVGQSRGDPTPEAGYIELWRRA